MITLDRIRATLGAHRRRELAADGLTPAAVLVPLFLRAGRVHLLMEKRTENLDHHKGQVSFPGGRCEPDDRDVVETALRETYEEVGLAPGDVEFYGLLDDIVTVTRFRVTPVVGRIPDEYAFRPAAAEVDRLLRVPCNLFLAEPDQSTTMEHDGQAFEVRAYPFEGHQIWGATARITRSLVELVESQAVVVQ
jgi:8-oxo-dGTP pyrophosphatase MutT (NUDIX family)